VPVGVGSGAADSAGAGVVVVGVGVDVVAGVVGVEVAVGVGVAVVVGVGVPVGRVPLVQVTELPSAERTHTICEPVLAGVVVDGVGVADPVPDLGGLGLVTIVVTVVVLGVGVTGTTVAPRGTVVVVTVRLPAEFPVRADVAVPAEGRPSDSGVAPAARAALTAFAMATAPLCASFAPA
jgi:hypothetical protein